MSFFIAKINNFYGKYVLLGIDFAFIAASILRSPSSSFSSKDLLSISQDGGYAEHFQYAKLGVIVFLLCLLAIAKKSILIGGWAVIFAILLADDRLIIHEQLGGMLASRLSIPSIYYLRAQDYGEILVYLMWGVIAVTILAVSVWFDRCLVAQQVSKGLLLSLLGLVCVGGIFDMLHIVVTNIWRLSENANRLFDAIEDGGEMIIVTFALWFVYRMYLKEDLITD
jgi:hypothetical protein